MDGFISWKTLWEWDDSGVKNPPFSEAPQLVGPFERTNCSFAPSGFIETCQLLAHKVTESRPEGFSTIQCTQKLFLGEDGGVWMWKLKRDQGKHRKNELPIGGACVLNKKQLANASHLGKNMFEESTMEKKRLPPGTKTQFARNQLNAFIWGSHKTSIYTNTSIFIQHLSLQRGHMSLQRAQTSLREYIYIYISLNVTIYIISLYIVYPTKYL